MEFGLAQDVIDERLITDAGEDTTSVGYSDLDPSRFATVFNDPRFEDRRVDEFDPYVTYIAVDVTQVTEREAPSGDRGRDRPHGAPRCGWRRLRR